MLSVGFGLGHIATVLGVLGLGLGDGLGFGIRPRFVKIVKSSEKIEIMLKAKIRFLLLLSSDS